MENKEKLWKWLDENHEFLINYLDNSPQNFLNEIGIKRHTDSCNTNKSKQFLRIASNVTTGMVVKKVFSQNPIILKEMDETEVFTELVKDIASILDVNVLCYKILRNIATLTKSDRSSLFLTRGTRHQRYLVLKLSVTQTSSYEESLTTEETEITLPFGKGIAGHVAETKETVYIPNAYEDPRFLQDVDKRTGYHTHSILCKPILSHDGECIGVAQIINKIGEETFEFSQHDRDIFERFLMFCGIGLINAQLFEMSVNEYQRNQVVLNLAQDLFSEQTTLVELVRKIAVYIQEILQCERCSVYLLPSFDDSLDQVEEFQPEKQYASADDITFSTSFDMYDNKLHVTKSRIASSENARVARDVVFTRNFINIPNLKLEPKYGGSHFVNKKGFRTKSILSIPIFDSKDRIIGVAQQANKIDTVAFSEHDEQIIKAFSIFIGLGIYNCSMYENACKLSAKQDVALGILSVHSTANKNERDALVHANLRPAHYWDIYSFDLDDLLMDDFELAKTVIKMFLEMNILKKYSIPYAVMCQWVMSVKKNYRLVTYHNWRHAFNVGQTCFAMMYTGGLYDVLNDLEMFALLVASLCHDLDHRGTNNAFQVKVDAPLATLYSTSVMEHHHFDQCVMILNTEGNNIFQSLSSENYRIVLGYIEHAILSTDLAKYFQKRDNFQALLENPDTNYKEDHNKKVIKAMMMTACDLAATCKPWDIQFRTSILITSEFFEQGDIERQKLGEAPIAMMDRRKDEQMPSLQLYFYDSVCIPLYDMFATYDHKLSPLLDGCQRNHDMWETLMSLSPNKFKRFQQKQLKKIELKKKRGKEKDSKRCALPYVCFNSYT